MYYRYCKIEANTALRWKITMVACCVEEGYEADYWLGVITSAAPGLDCSADEKFSASFERLVKELRSAHLVIKSKYKMVLIVLPKNATYMTKFSTV